MAKNNKKTPAAEAPVVENPANNEEKKTPAKVNVMQVGDLDKIKQSYAKNGGLDPNHRVDVLMGIKTYFKDDPNAAANTGVPQEAVDKINGIAAIGFVAALGDEIMMGQSGWAQKMRMTQIEAINAVQEITGISIDVKALPAPDSNGETQVKQENIKVSKETKEALKEAKQANDDANSGKKEYLNDHTKIETDEQLKEALGFQLVNTAIVNPVDRLITTAQFYRSYLEARAEKTDNAEAELAKIHEFTLANLLQDIITMVDPTYVTKGFGRILCVSAENSKSVVSAFNMFKRTCYDKKTKKYRYTDEEIAAFVRVLIVWYATTKIADLGKNIKVLSKDANANAKAIDGCNNAIKHFQWMIDLTTEPNFSIVDGLVDAYNSDEDPAHKQAEAIVKSIIETYYKDVEVNDLTRPVIVLNAKQYAGVVMNLFRDPLARRNEFSLENLIELPEPSEEATAEETVQNEPAAEEKSKN